MIPLIDLFTMIKEFCTTCYIVIESKTTFSEAEKEILHFMNELGGI